MVAFKGIVCVVVVIIQCSCQGGPVVEQELIGTYSLESPSSMGYLELQADGTYKQEVTTQQSGQVKRPRDNGVTTRLEVVQ